MCLWNLLGIGTFMGGLTALFFAWLALTKGEIVGAIILTLLGLWFAYGGFKAMTRKEWPR